MKPMFLAEPGVALLLASRGFIEKTEPLFERARLRSGLLRPLDDTNCLAGGQPVQLIPGAVSCSLLVTLAMSEFSKE